MGHSRGTLSALANLEGVAPAGVPQRLPGPDRRGPVGLAVWLPDQDGVGPEGGHAVLPCSMSRCQT